MMGSNLSKLYIVIGARTESFNKAMDRVSNRMQQLSKGMKIAGAAMTAMGVAGLKLSADARKLNATLGQTALNLNTTTKEMRDLALETTNVTFSLNEVINTFDLLARAGVKDKEVLKKVSTAFDTLGDAIGVPASQVTAQLIPAMKTFNVSAEEMAGKTDSLTWLFRNTTVNLDDFNRMIGYTTPELVAMGLTVEDMIAILAELEEQGYSGIVMTRMFMKAVTLATKEQIPLNEALRISTEKIEGYKVEMEGATGITQKYADVANSQYGVMDKLKQKMSELTFVMGSFLTPLEPLLIAFTALGPLMIFLSTSLGIATIKWAAHTCAVIASTIALKAAAIAQWAWNVAIAANPIAAVLVVIGALVAAIMGISRAWETTTETTRRELEEQTRLVKENTDRQKQMIWDRYNADAAAIDAETQAKIDALDEQNEAIRRGERDEQLADKKQLAWDKALAGDQADLIQWVKDAAIAANNDKMAALRASGEEEKLSIAEIRDIDLAYWDEKAARVEAVNDLLIKQNALMEQIALREMHAGVTGPVVLPSQMGGFTLPKYDMGGLIPEPTLLWGMKSGQPYATAEAGETVSPIGDTITNFSFPIANLVVREEADIPRIARELYKLQRINARAAGVA